MEEAQVNLVEAKKLARVASTADGGCSSCVNGIIGELNKEFPAFEWSYDESKDYTPEAVNVKARK